MGRHLRLLCCLAILSGMMGCRVLGDSHPLADGVIHASDNLASRASFLRWNMRSRAGQDECLDSCSRALELAGRSAFELDSLMARQPAPPVDILHGRWHGINKGVGAAAIGLTQDIKVFDVHASQGKGHNVAVYQVAMDQLSCRGFQPKTNWLTGCEKTMGDFIIQPPCSSCEPLKLDYTQAHNSLVDPSRVLVDELVMMDHDLLLGRAHAKVGQHLVPVAYFVLMRGESGACDVGP